MVSLHMCMLVVAATSSVMNDIGCCATHTTGHSGRRHTPHTMTVPHLHASESCNALVVDFAAPRPLGVATVPLVSRRVSTVPFDACFLHASASSSAGRGGTVTKGRRHKWQRR